MDEVEDPQANQTQSLAWNPRRDDLLQPAVDIPAEDPPHLLDYLNIVRKRRWAVYSCLLIVFGISAIGTFRQRPVYRATALLEVNPEAPDVLNLKDLLQAGSTTDLETYRATQIKVLTSRSLAERVIEKLQLQTIPEFQRRGILWGLVEGNVQAPPAAGNLAPGASSDEFRAVQHFLDSLQAKEMPHTSLIQLSFDSNDPKLAAQVANQMADEYIYQNLQAKWDESQKASEWLADRLRELKAKLEKSEDELQAYAAANAIVFVTDKQNLDGERTAQLQLEYTRAQAERFQKESLLPLVQSAPGDNVPGYVSDKLVQELEGRLTDLQREYAKVTASVKPEHPKAVQIQRQIDSTQASLARVKKLLGGNITDEYKSALAHEQFLARALDEQKKEMNAAAQRAIQYNILKREADSNRQLYDALLQRLKESQIHAGMKASNIRVVDSAEVPRKPTKPRVALNLTLGVILGLSLGVGVAFFQDYLDKTLKGSDEVEALLRLPSLGVVPIFSPNGDGHAGEEKSTAIATRVELALAPAIQTNALAVESYRSLRTSILLSADPVPKLLLITSALPGEGKTTTTLNLGATFASLGSRVVIVDCDMRRPACHRSTGVENKPGFVQCLTGRVELAEAVLPVPGVPNLSVIPCGPIPPNPAEVLSSTVTSDLLRKLRSQFEYVLVDSPPLLSVADSRILATMTDATVLVVLAYSSPYDIVRQAKNSLYKAGARVLGVALNKVDFQRDGYGYGYYYRYGYGYGNGHGDDSDSQDSRDNA